MGRRDTSDQTSSVSETGECVKSRQSFVELYLDEVKSIVGSLDSKMIERMVALLVATRQRRGRLFILGVGGSAANASHAVNDFRKIAGFEAYAPTDNVSELTARTNDEGWATVFQEWLAVSRLSSRDTILVLSVGGGDAVRNVSPNLVAALDYARSQGATILGIVGRDLGHTAQVADACVVVPVVNPARVTPHAEAFQAVVWHLLVSHPALQLAHTKWESVALASERSRAVFLDRDGVINRAVVRDGRPYPPATLKEFAIVREARQCAQRLRQLGFRLFVVTNQPDVARGSQSVSVVERMHDKLREALPVDDVLVCFHDDAANCACRKPRPGLLLAAQKKHLVELSESFLIGDRWVDIDAGHAAGCKAILIDRHYRERPPRTEPDARVPTLTTAVKWIEQQVANGGGAHA